MAEWGETIAEFDLTTSEVTPVDFINRYYPEVLSPEEIIIADRLTAQITNSVQALTHWTKLPARLFVVAIASHLVKKLKSANLTDDSIGVISERVWWGLMETSGLGNGMPPDALDPNCSGNEALIAERILRRTDGKIFSAVEEEWAGIVETAGPKISSKIIRAVARKTWPEMRAKLKI